jgi:hypothetical protein
MWLWWLVLEPGGVDVCSKDPGFAVDVTVTGPIGALVDVHLGFATWRDCAGKVLRIEGDRDIARRLPAWLRLDQVMGRDLPIVPLEAG